MASENDLPGGEALRIALRVIHILEGLGTPAWIGGSLASSIFGIPRATQDADIVADLQAESVPAFVHQLGKDFYADSERILMGVERLSSFNVIHLATMFKVDVFLLGSSPWALKLCFKAETRRIPPTRQGREWSSRELPVEIGP